MESFPTLSCVTKRMSEKRYYTFGRYLRERFGERVHKIAIDAGFTCPNLDGLKSSKGCSYCNNSGFSYNSRRSIRPISEQIEQGIAFMRKRFKARKFMAYFQAFSNTYAPLRELKQTYDQILPWREHFVAMSVGTRPDCVSPGALDLLEGYTDLFEVWVEYGLQSSHNRTLERINRCHTVERFLQTIEITAQRNLKTCVHVILGLPGETHADMMQTADLLATLPFHSLKVHLLHIMKHTVLEQEYMAGRVPIFSMDEYVQTCVDFLERIPPHVSIQRLTADAPSDVLVAPLWCQQRKQIYDRIDQELERRNSCQGRCCSTRERSYEKNWKYYDAKAG
jgi:radical SAM protein (TIGR01212 family)